MKKKPIYAKPRPKKLGKPKSFNKKSKAYKSAKRQADKKFGKKVSLYKKEKNIFILHKLLKNTNLEKNEPIRYLH
jgi:hypothetical protein